MKIFRTYLLFMMAIALVSCSTESSSDTTDPVVSKLLKEINWNTGYSEKYTYNDQDQLIRIVHNDNGNFNTTFNDTTYITYTNGKIATL